jgi:hypothetical protein
MRPTARLARFAAALSLALAALVLSAAGALASPGHGHHHHHKHFKPGHGPGAPPPRPSVFVQNDDPAGNVVYAYDRRPDGSLEAAGGYETGGLGGALEGAVVDHLASQGALTYDRAHGLLYAVNAGSDSLTVFAVRPGHLVRTQVISSGGEFPVSVSVHDDLVYVLNARGGGSVQGYVRTGVRLHQVPSWHRDLGLDPNAEPEFTHTPGQVAFTPRGSQLIVTTKANTHSVLVFRVFGFGGLSADPVVNELPGTVPFAGDFDAAGHLVLTEAGPSVVASFAVNGNGTLSPIDEEATGQAATCWVIAAGSRFYASNTGSDSISGYDGSFAGLLTPLGLTPTGPGPVDATATADGRFLYVQTGANGFVDGFRIEPDGSLSPVGSTAVPNAVGGEGIAST